MTVLQWVLYAVVSVGSGVLGFVAGQIVHWRRHPDSFFVVTPTVVVNERSKRLGVMLLGILAVVTVASSTLTSLELQRETARRAEDSAWQRECSLQLAERVAERVKITEADHRNTTDFVVEVRDAMASGPESGAYPLIVAAADRYIERQDRLAESKQSIPLNSDACR